MFVSSLRAVNEQNGEREYNVYDKYVPTGADETCQ